MNARPLWGLLAIGAATAVGVTTHDAGFVVITFFGSLWVPRLLGLRGHHHRGPWGAAACAGRHAGRRHLEDRLAEWHREAHSGKQDAAPVA